MSARSHGISCTSFLVYSPDLPIQVTIAYLDFAVFGQLVPCTRLNIRFLFVEPRFRYVFLSPPLTEVSFDSRYRVHRQQVPQGNCTPDVQHARRTKLKEELLFLFLHSPHFAVSDERNSVGTVLGVVALFLDVLFAFRIQNVLVHHVGNIDYFL